MLIDAGPYAIQEATELDAGIIAGHRSSMFREMGSLDEKATELLRVASEPWIRKLLQERAYVGWLVQHGETVVGGAGMHLVTFGPKPDFHNGGTGAHIANVYVQPSHRNRGLGEKLMRGMLQWAKTEGVGEITLSASEQAKGLYQRLGFKPDANFYILKL